MRRPILLSLCLIPILALGALPAAASVSFTSFQASALFQSFPGFEGTLAARGWDFAQPGTVPSAPMLMRDAPCGIAIWSASG